MSFQLTQLIRQKLGDQVSPRLLESITKLQEQSQNTINGMRSDLDALENGDERKMIMDENLIAFLQQARKIMGDHAYYQVFQGVNIRSLNLLT